MMKGKKNKIYIYDIEDIVNRTVDSDLTIIFLDQFPTNFKMLAECKTSFIPPFNVMQVVFDSYLDVSKAPYR